jgi:hypothetical protein
MSTQTAMRCSLISNMNIRRLISIMAATTILSCAAPAMAQTTPAFRVPIGQESAASTVNAAWIWAERVSNCDNTCGAGNRTTSYECQNAADFDFSGGGYGLPEADASCTAKVGPKPAPVGQTCSNYSGCTYDWVKPAVVKTPIPLGANPVGRVGCGNVNNVFSPYCQRGSGSNAVQMAKGDYRFCSSDTPDYNEVAAGEADALGFNRDGIETNACNTTDHDWKAEPSQWSDTAPWSSDCSNTATQTRVVSCTRRFDGSTPANADAACGTANKPAASRTAGRYGSCGYKAVNPSGWGAWASACSASTTRTRHSQCQRSNDGGQIVGDSECTSRGVTLDESESGSNYSGCSSSWRTGAWTSYDSSCGTNATRTRAVTCNRDLDNAAQPDSACSSTPRPAASESAPQYQNCGYTPVNPGAWGAWASGCSSSTTRTRQYQCQRSNDGGQIVPDGECLGRQVGLTETQTGANYASCGYTFSVGGWSGWNSTCSSSATRTRGVTCVRSDGAAVADAECTNRGIGRPASSETQGVYDSCGYVPRETSRSTCNMQGQQTVTWDCTRSVDGATGFPASYCGKQPSETAACTPPYTWGWSAGGWSGYNSGCSASATRTRPVTCVRNDGYTDSDQFCNAGTRPTSSETAAQYGSCGYAAGGNASRSDWSSTCSSASTRNAHYQCIRSDGTPVADGECTNRGVGLDATETAPIYSGCGYSVEATTPFGACTNGTQSRSVQCRRSDGVLVDNSFCGNGGTQSQACTAAAPACYSPSTYGLTTMRREGGSNFTGNNGTYSYTATTQNQNQYACGQTLTGYVNVTNGGVTQRVSASCSASSSSPGSCSAQQTTNVGGKDFAVWVRISSYSATMQSCTVNVSLVNPPATC